MTPFEWLVLSLASFRIQRLVTKDDLPPSQWLREKVRSRFGEGSYSYLLVICAWCFGFWVTVAVFSEHHFLAVIPIWLYAVLAASTIVGMLGNYDD